MEISFADHEVVPIKELVGLYEAVGWLIYAADPDALARAVDRSSYVVTARNAEGDLVGLARCLTDDVSILYLQDLLVHPDYRRQGIASVLASRILRVYAHVRQKVLLTDNEAAQHELYRDLGFTNLNDLSATGLNAFIQINGLE